MQTQYNKNLSEDCSICKKYPASKLLLLKKETVFSFLPSANKMKFAEIERSPINVGRRYIAFISMRRDISTYLMLEHMKRKSTTTNSASKNNGSVLEYIAKSGKAPQSEGKVLSKVDLTHQ